MVCPICNNNDVREHHHLFDDRYGYPDNFKLLRCGRCNHGYLDIKFEPGELHNLYTDYYPRAHIQPKMEIPRADTYSPRNWLNGDYRYAYMWVPGNVRVLDVGCGFGETLLYHISRGCEAYGVEVDDNVKDIAARNNLNIHIGEFEPDQYQQDSFDYITLDQVIEHFHDPAKVLRGIHKVLKSNGEVILSTPNIDGWGPWVFGKRWINWHAPYHLHHFTRKSMSILTNKTGFYIKRVRTITSSEWLRYQWIHLLAYPDCGKPSPAWSARQEFSKNKKAIKKVLGILHIMKINHIVTRLADSLGRGDNQIFFLGKK